MCFARGFRHLEYPIVFHIFGAVALVSTLAFQIMASSAGACSKAFSAVRQWKDPKTWLLGENGI